MINNTKIQANYTTKTKNFQLVFPINFEINCENLFVDGTKIEANANKYTFVWKKTILKNQEKLQDKMHKKLPALLDKYGFKMYLAEDIRAKRLKKFIDKLNKIKSTYRNDIGRAENMQYDENTDTYTCHYWRKIFNVGVRKSKKAGCEHNFSHVIGKEGHRFYADDAWPVMNELIKDEI